MCARSLRSGPSLALCLSLTAWLLAAPAARAADPFYEALLRDGILAADRGHAARAAKLLDLACFGLLEEPPVLTRCLTRLAIAQSDLGDEEAFFATFQRVLEIEQGFGGYRQAELTDGERRLFEERLTRHVEPAILARTATFRALAEPESPADPEPEAPREEVAAVEPPADPEPAPPPQPPREEVADLDLPADPEPPPVELRPVEMPEEVRQADAEPAAGDATDPELVFVPVPEEPPPAAVASNGNDTPRLDPGELSADEQAEIASAVSRAQEVKGGSDRGVILLELERLREIADRYPAERDLQILTAELSYRVGMWNESRAYFERAGDPGDPLSSFYFAIALYETGAARNAAELLERCLPRLSRTPFVESYVAKIMGPAAGN